MFSCVMELPLLFLKTPTISRAAPTVDWRRCHPRAYSGQITPGCDIAPECRYQEIALAIDAVPARERSQTNAASGELSLPWRP
jgi:hypothetical protein